MSDPQIDILRDDAEGSRNFKRFVLQLTVAITPSYSCDSPFAKYPASRTPAKVNNISVSGMSFRSSLDLPEQTLALVNLTLAKMPFCFPVIVHRVKAVRREGQALYECGSEYVKCEATNKFIPLLAKYLLSQGLVKRDLINGIESEEIGEPEETDEPLSPMEEIYRLTFGAAA